MKTILFVLKDDKIYDAWIQKAEELQFTSLDNTGVPKTNIARQPSSNTQQTTGTPNENDGLNVPKPASNLKIIDASTSHSPRRPNDSDPERSALDPDETSDGQGNTKKEEDDIAPDENDKTKRKRYVISTAGLIMFVIFYLRILMNRRIMKIFKHFDISLFCIHNIFKMEKILQISCNSAALPIFEY